MISQRRTRRKQYHILNEKKDRDIKARSCANGNPQREHIAKEEATAPTVALESVFITSTIDAKDRSILTCQ
jgi:hypothetical protein